MLKNNTIFHILSLIFSLLLIYILNKNLIDLYAFSKYVGGWDGSGHFSIGKLYMDNIFPSTWGWIENWYNGMPFPQFYPPLFYYLTSLISSVLNINYESVFRFFVMGTGFIIPFALSFFYFYRIKKSKKESFAVLLLTTLLLSFDSPFGYVGVSLTSFMNNGLVTQPLGFLMMLSWLFFFVKSEHSDFYKYLSGFFLFLVFLSNAHIVFVTFFLFVTIYVLRIIRSRSRKEVFSISLSYFLMGAIPLAVAAFWYVPMLYYYKFNTSSALFVHWISLSDIFFGYFYVTVAIVLFFVFYRKTENDVLKAVAICYAGFFLMKLFQIEKYFPKAPIHPERWIGTIFFLTPLVLVYVFAYFYKTRDKKLSLVVMYLLVVVFLGNTFRYEIFSDDEKGFFVDDSWTNIEEITDYFEDLDGLILVEVYDQDTKPSDKTLNAYLGLQGNKTSYTVIRESAISSLIHIPLRNSVSSHMACWGIRCNLSYDEDYLDKESEQHIKTAIDYGVDYFLIRTKEQKENFDINKKVKLVSEIGGWNVYKRIAEPDPINPSQNFLVFSDLKTKGYSAGTDFISFVEYINIRLGKTDMIFAHANRDLVEQIDNFQYFNQMIFDNYKYEDLELAKKKIDEILDFGIYIIAAEPKVKNNLYFYVMSKSQEEKVLVLENLKDFEVPKELEELEIGDIKYIARGVDFHRKLHEIFVEVVEENKSKNKFNYQIFKQSYFPAWKSISGSEVFMVSPVHSMVVSDKETNVYFDITPASKRGHLVSLVALLISTVILLYCVKKD
jgi:hypothetical protein